MEDLVRLANAAYRARKVAVIYKVPTEWVPIRDERGRIAAAKVERKAAVDFLGHVLLPSGRAVPVAFDVKEVRRGDRWPLAKLPAHQYEYLADCAATGAVAFVLIAFWDLPRFYVLPFAELERRVEARQSGGLASVRAGEPGLIEVRFPDYLDFVPTVCGEGGGLLESALPPALQESGHYQACDRGIPDQSRSLRHDRRDLLGAHPGGP